MPYTSYVTGVITPAEKLDELLEFLDGWSFIVDENGGLENSVSGWSTGFAVRRDNKLAGIGEWSKTYGFNKSFIEALIAASKADLLAYAYLHREGEDHDDKETYEYIGGVWYTWAHLDFKVPLGDEDRFREEIYQAAKEVT